MDHHVVDDVIGYPEGKTSDMLVSGDADGPWNEAYGLYFEDGDLTMRAREANIPIKLIDVPVLHIGRATGKAFNMLYKYHESKKIFTDIWKDKLK